MAVCSHGDRKAAPCGDDRWCHRESGHGGPHTGQEERCDCGIYGKDPRYEWTEVCAVGGPSRWVRGPCKHVEPEPVRTLGGQLVAFLCITCGEQLPT